MLILQRRKKEKVNVYDKDNNDSLVCVIKVIRVDTRYVDLTITYTEGDSSICLRKLPIRGSIEIGGGRNHIKVAVSKITGSDVSLGFEAGSYYNFVRDEIDGKTKEVTT